MRFFSIPMIYSPLLAFLIGSFSYGAETVSRIPFMNLLEYRRELFQIKTKADDRCAMNLRVRPSLRYLVLKDGHSYDWLVSDKNYSAIQKKNDQEWAAALQNLMRKQQFEIEAKIGVTNSSDSPWVFHSDKNLDRLSGYQFYPGFYSLDKFASYQVGSSHMLWGKDRGFTFKVFFEFKNPQIDLTRNLYKEFSKKLSEAGFEGDSKIPVLPGWIRFTWNNVIVHAPSAAAAKIAEKIGLDFFGDRLASYSRGVDVRDVLNPAEITDWPHFLCNQDPSTLPKDISDFVQNK
jgi:hypothetical protein